MELINGQTVATEAPAKLEVLNGTYTPREAREALVNLIKCQANMYKIQNLGLDLRFGEQSEEIWKRLEELEDAREITEALIEKAALTGQKLTIRSKITIELDDSDQQQ